MIVIDWHGSMINIDEVIGITKSSQEQKDGGCRLKLKILLKSGDTLFEEYRETFNVDIDAAYKKMQEDYDELANILIKYNGKNKGFVCSYCGAPNS